jgi:putative flippase GtrA
MNRILATESAGNVERLLRFLAVGVLNTAFGYGVYAVLVLLGLAPQLALATAFAIGILWNFGTHRKLVFATGGRGKLPSYAGAYLLVYAVNALTLAAALRNGVDALIAQAVLAVVMALLSFFLIGRVLTGAFPFFGGRR